MCWGTLSGWLGSDTVEQLPLLSRLTSPKSLRLYPSQLVSASSFSINLASPPFSIPPTPFLLLLASCIIYLLGVYVVWSLAQEDVHFSGISRCSNDIEQPRAVWERRPLLHSNSVCMCVCVLTLGSLRNRPVNWDHLALSTIFPPVLMCLEL